MSGEKPPVVAWSDEKETHIGKTVLPVPISNPNQIIAFDFDYDFKNDLAIATEKGFRLFKQTDGENFEDVTANTKLSNEILQKSYAGVWTLDVENDGDLDLILARTDLDINLAGTGEPIVLQNNSDGSFSTVRNFERIRGIVRFAWADLDEDGDSDAIFLDEFGHLICFFQRTWRIFKELIYSNGNQTAGFTVGDVNGDGNC